MPALSWLDRLPAWVRHPLIVFVASFVGDLGQAVIRAGGVTGLPWPGAELHAVDTAAMATAAAVLALAGTPLTRQYGVGAKVLVPPGGTVGATGMQSSVDGSA